MKNRDDILQLIRDIMQEMFEIEADEVTLEANLYKDLDFDSIDAVDMIVKLKEMTGKALKPEDFKNARTISDVVEAVYKLINE
ncbi:MAG: acyl carrier protein [Methylococcaceae bacterium NSP1-1]|jgi:acyl carrier protein|nr:acyl carrier protein [Methylococcaceae bacterium]MDD1640675.1 acyl carrier protein [Methylococcaceae bacterium]OYV17224.1 MAG: acyl carrier protein [Methylococcaceae bacterium NSP1-1]OYV22886.1 MAG: acyl carrier protein [Methylococcaceae bacterium NSO1]HSN22779.1 acyl carrier protein [Methylomicrobium sp.]